MDMRADGIMKAGGMWGEGDYFRFYILIGLRRVMIIKVMAKFRIILKSCNLDDMSFELLSYI